MNNAREIAIVLQKYFGIVKSPHDEPTKAFLRQCQSNSITSKNNTYNYYQRGKGPTVLLIHGLHSNLGSMVPIAQDLIEQKLSVVLFDAPAHGEAIGTNTNILQVRDFIHTLNDNLGELYAIICHSLGGLWALSAWNNQFHAKTLISISTPSNHQFLVKKFVDLHQLSDDIAEGLINQLERRFGETVWTDFSPSTIVKTLDVPGLVIHGANDDFVPPSHAEKIHSSWGKSKLAILEDIGHFDITGSLRAREIVKTYLRRC